MAGPGQMRLRAGLRLAAALGGYWRKSIRPAAPLRLWVDITSRCNLSCPACPQRLLPADQRQDMDPALLASLVRQAGALKAAVNLFHRGEPLLHPELPYWIRRFEDAGCPVRIHSNATLLSPGRVAGLLWARPGLLTLSIDSLDPGEYARARPGASLAKALVGIKRLLRGRARLGLKRPVISLLTMGDARPGPAQRGAISELKALGLDRALHRRPHNWAGAVGGAALGPPRLACTFPWYGLAVLSDGRVTPCPQDFFGQMVLGRADREPLTWIWRNQAAKGLRQAHRALALEDYPVCADCDRVRRGTRLGLPTEHLKNFLAESIVRAPGRP